MSLPDPVILCVYSEIGFHTFQCRPADTFEAVKLAIAQETGIPPSWQTLQIPPDHILERFGIEAPGCFRDFNDYSTLQSSFLRGGRGIYEGAHAILCVHFAGGPVKIYRSNWRLTPAPAEVFFSDRILKIKARIEASQSIPVAQQRLFFGDRELDDQLFLDAMPPPETPPWEGTHFRLVVVDPIRIWIQPLIGQRFPVETNQDDLIKEVKTKIEAASSIASRDQHLFWGWRELLDDATLRDWFIERDFTLYLRTEETKTEWKSKGGSDRPDDPNPFLHIQIHDLESKWTRSLTVRRSDVIDDTISSLGSFDRTKPREGQDPGLWFGGLRLEGRSTFGANSIADGTTLHLERYAPYEIFVRNLTGRHYAVEVSVNDSVAVLKRLIRYKEGIRVDEQRLTFAGHQLEDYNTLQDYQLVKDSTVDLHLLLRGGRCA
jgi:hypothetical protein